MARRKQILYKNIKTPNAALKFPETGFRCPWVKKKNIAGCLVSDLFPLTHESVCMSYVRCLFLMTGNHRSDWRLRRVVDAWLRVFMFATANLVRMLGQKEVRLVKNVGTVGLSCSFHAHEVDGHIYVSKSRRYECRSFCYD